MRKKNLVAGFIAVMLVVSTILTSVGLVQAEEVMVTDKLMVALEFKGEVGEKKMSQEDADVIAEAFGYYRFDGEVMVCDENTFAQVNWDNSTIPYGEVYCTSVFEPQLSRDKNGKLVVKKDEYGELKVKLDLGGSQWICEDNGRYKEGDGDRNFDLRDSTDPDYANEEYYINSHMGKLYGYSIKGKKLIDDAYVVRFYYTNDGKGNYYVHSEDFPNYTDTNGPTYKDEERVFGYTDWWIIPESALNSTVLKLEEKAEDTSSVEKYTIELSQDKTSISSSELETVLEENQTKDVVIKSNNDVTFTFKKGTMQSIEGKDSYDFSATMNTTYSEDLPIYVTKDNFITKIDYNYSGKLPGEATIRFYVGTQYAGKKLYYSLLNEDKTYAEVQTVIVDSEGYMTIKQDHCSSYLVTNENPAKADCEHTYSEIVTKATLDKDGSVQTVCSKCDDITETIAIPAPITVSVAKSSVTYSGKAQKIDVTVEDNIGEKIASTNYMVSYKNNKNVGQATVTVTLKGNYSGTLSANFIIKPKSTKIVSVTPQKKGFTLKWKKQKSQTTGYQIQYATNKKFTAAKTVKVNKKQIVTKKVSNLNAKKTYYVRVRTYKTAKVNGKNTKIYSDWSKVKKVVTK